MPAVDREEGRGRLVELAERYREAREYYRSPEFDETATRELLINPLFQALGWDVLDQYGLGPRRDVVVHQRLPIAQVAGYAEWDEDLTEEELRERIPVPRVPDYSFRLGEELNFYVEAKRPLVSLSQRAPCFQIKSYGWTAGLAVSVLTSFDGFRLFDCTARPEWEQANAGLLLELAWDSYEAEWDRLWDTFARESVSAGSLETLVQQRRRVRGRRSVDAAFLRELSDWRSEVALDFHQRNPQLDGHELAEATQRFLDRVIFMRVCEDRTIEPDPILRRFARMTDSYARLTQTLRALDAVYNGQLFAHHFSERLSLADQIVQRLIERLYPPISPYRFTVIGADILGAVYERFLGKTIEIDQAGVLQIQDKPEVRHAGGVYYTPNWVVAYIVAATIDPLLADRTPRTARNLRILDPACGSGSFLVEAFDHLVRWHEGYYDENPTETPDRHYVDANGQRRLTSDAKAEILESCIHGVDIDPQAVEVTQMSLYLKLLEGDNFNTLAPQRLFHRAVLPPLMENIRCGNSLLGTNDVPAATLLRQDLARRINPFDWEDARTGFGQVIRDGGFDTIIGNPPYTRIQELREWRPDETDALVAKYPEATSGSFDIAGLFIERCRPFLRQRRDRPGSLAFIISRQIAEANYAAPVRRSLAQSRAVREIVDFRDGLVFPDAGAYTFIIVADAGPNETFRLTRVMPPPSAHALRLAQAPGSPLAASSPGEHLDSPTWTLELPEEAVLIQHLERQGTRLGDLALGAIFQGVITGADTTVYRLVDRGPHAGHPSIRSVSVRGDLARTFPVEARLLRPVFAGRSAIRRFSVEDSEDLLLFPYDRERDDQAYSLIPPARLRRDYPRAWSWLRQNEARLRTRAGEWTDANWFAFSRRQNLERFHRPKTMVPYMIDHLAATWDEQGHFFVNVSTGGYGIEYRDGVDPIFVTALLNSQLLSWVIAHYSRVWRGGWFAARSATLARLPIVDTDDETRSDISDAFRACTAASASLDAALADHDRNLADRRLAGATQRFDELVFDAYNVSGARRALVQAS